MKVHKPQRESIGAEVLDLDVKLTSSAEAIAIKELVYDHKLVIFRNQSLNEKQYLEFSQKIGTPQIYPQDNYHHPDHPEIFVSSNILKDGKKFGMPGTGRYWHTDCAFLDEPLPFTMLYPQIIPQSNRETYYLNMELVYEKLPAHLKMYVEGKYLKHEAKWRYKVQECDLDRAIIDIMHDFENRFPAVQHPAVITHPVTQKKSLYMSSGFTTGIIGLDYETNQKILQELFSFMERDEFIHKHKWNDGDLILWENRTLNHKASISVLSEESLNYRIGVYDGLPFYVSSPSSVNPKTITEALAS
ncbi:MAG: TauD/TfdA family dioxygenase [Okeania sp. SIO3B5]|uniref:TauD/TfdA dioxygenase family protein n=1 Tax=Okeania sp. SIO3B5 TaxID=2607811 RepID=UPI0013FF085F|nr:TauD/TfdA family dioxygenase [Okeania sp. SIO3B5]NEO53124.1 TauD/TfdA family dioxygenase [Okeania sp. SIO3B5]